MDTANTRLMSSRRFLLRLTGIALFAAWGFRVPTAAGHAFLMTYIQHRVAMTVGPTNIDIRVELTFFEVRSMAERRRMDADHDGRITAAEIKAYLAGLADSFEQGLRLIVAGRPVDVVALYDPEVDLQGVDEIAPCHHVLRLFCFARTPPGLAAGDDIVLEDRLWSGAPAIRSFEVVGHGGCQVAAVAEAAPVTSPDSTGPHRMHVRCLAMPQGWKTTSVMADASTAGGAVPARPRLRVLLVGTLLLAVSVAGGLGLWFLRRRE